MISKGVSRVTTVYIPDPVELLHPFDDERAAAEAGALQENRIFGAALDVLVQEPPAPDNPLLRMDPQRVILTPHFAASSEEIHPAVHREVAQSVAAVLAGRWPAAAMNPTVVPKKPLIRIADCRL